MKRVLIALCFLSVISCAVHADVLDDYFSSGSKPAPTAATSPETTVTSPETTVTKEAVKLVTVEAVPVVVLITSEAGALLTKPLSLETTVTLEVKAPVIIIKTIKYPVASSAEIYSYFMAEKKFTKYAKKVMAGKPDTGMTSDMLYLIYGEPDRKIVKQLKKINIEVWVIDNSLKNTDDRTFTIIGLKDDRVVSMDNHNISQDTDKTVTDLSK